MAHIVSFVWPLKQIVIRIWLFPCLLCDTFKRKPMFFKDGTHYVINFDSVYSYFNKYLIPQEVSEGSLHDKLCRQVTDLLLTLYINVFSLKEVLLDRISITSTYPSR